jgi:hypothetical protein
VVGLFALASVGGAAVLFMLVFLGALLRDSRPRIRVAEIRLAHRRGRIGVTPASFRHNSTELERVA